MKKPHLLLLRFSALGDVAMTVPIIRCLYKSHSDLKITFVSRPYFEPIFKEFENFNFYPLDIEGRHKGVKGIWTLFLELKNTLSLLLLTYMESLEPIYYHFYSKQNF